MKRSIQTGLLTKIIVRIVINGWKDGRREERRKWLQVRISTGGQFFVGVH